MKRYTRKEKSQVLLFNFSEYARVTDWQIDHSYKKNIETISIIQTVETIAKIETVEIIPGIKNIWDDCCSRNCWSQRTFKRDNRKIKTFETITSVIRNKGLNQSVQ